MRTTATIALVATAASALADLQYTLVDLGSNFATGTYSSGRNVSSGGTTVFYAAGNNNAAFTRNPSGTVTSLGLASGYNRANPEGVNDAGLAVGVVQQGAFGTQKAAYWENGVASLYTLNGVTNGKAQAVNNNGLAAGSVGSGINQRAALFTKAGGSQTLAATVGGNALTVAYGINDAGLAVGQASVLNSAAAYRAFAYDTSTGVATDLGVAGASNNGSIAYAVSRNGFVAGSSMFNGGVTSDAFIWDRVNGIRLVAALDGSDRMQARGVNSSGWTVGQDFAHSTAFLNDGATSYSLNSLVTGLPAGWDLNTAFGIADDGTIVGQGAFNGTIRAFALRPVPEPASLLALGLGAVTLMRRQKK